jgi:hypothetical protein
MNNIPCICGHTMITHNVGMSYEGCTATLDIKPKYKWYAVSGKLFCSCRHYCADNLAYVEQQAKKRRLI